MKITMIIPSENGVAYHRMIGPLADLGRQKKIRVSQTNAMNIKDLHKLDGEDIVMFNRELPSDDSQKEIIQAIKSRNSKAMRQRRYFRKRSISRKRQGSC